MIPFFFGFIAATLILGSTLLELGDPLTTKIVQGAIGIPLIFIGLLSVFGFSSRVALPEKGNRKEYYKRTSINLLALLLGAVVAVAGSFAMSAV